MTIRDRATVLRELIARYEDELLPSWTNGMPEHRARALLQSLASAREELATLSRGAGGDQAPREAPARSKSHSGPPAAPEPLLSRPTVPLPLPDGSEATPGHDVDGGRDGALGDHKNRFRANTKRRHER